MAAAPLPFDYQGLTAAIMAANKPLVDSLVLEKERRHELRTQVQEQGDKVWELDGEMKLLKGYMTTLVGQSADGSTGMVPRLERDMANTQNEISEMRTEMSAMKQQVGTVADAVTQMNSKLDAMGRQQADQKSWMDGWKGVGVAVGIIMACLTIVATLIAAIVFLFSHNFTIR